MTTRITPWFRITSAAWLAAASIALPTGASAHDAHQHAGHAAHAARSDGYQRSERTYAIPDVVLTDAEARPVRLRALLATPQPVMMNFIFTTCGTICPVMSRVFAEVPGKLGAAAKHLLRVSISIDPENDTPARLKSYAGDFDAGSQWTFLTGQLQDVKTVQLAFDSYRGDKMNHEPLTLIRRAPDQPWIRIDGFASAEELAREYRRAAGM
jgi:protein SCO1/2